MSNGHNTQQRRGNMHGGGGGQRGRSGRGDRRGHGGGGGKSIGPCPDGISKHGMQAISAPYNFVPLATWVHIPEWSRQVSHDVPFKDGLSGELAYRLVAESPLLVGGHQNKDVQPQQVRPFQLPVDGRFAIPGSSIKGMLRAVVEIAGFGRMRMVDDARPGLRDITGPYVKAAYTDKVRDKVHPGFLRQAKGGGLEIVPCKMARLDHRDLEAALNEPKPIFKTRTSVAQKMAVWKRLCAREKRDPEVLTFELDGRDAKPRPSGSESGMPVFTGQISDSTKANGKRRDFIFYDPDDTAPVPVSTDTWRDFLRIHGNDEIGKRGEEMSWPGYWKKVHRNGGEVPVFYLQDGDLLRIGLAYMPKLAGDFSILDMIEHASEAHLQAPGLEYGYDLADLLFGAINGDRQQDALRGRVSCETAVAEGSPATRTEPDTILNSPKPTYFPNYIQQDANTRDWKLSKDQYATYVETQQSRRPLLRGFKRYPARPAEQTAVQRLTQEQKTNKKVQVSLRTLEPPVAFRGRIVFHNLLPAELGALLWTMTWGGNRGLRHGLGMGKSFGFGQVRLELDHEACLIEPNDPTRGAYTLTSEHLAELTGEFVRHMEVACRASGQGWADSIQLANLLAMADPEAAKRFPAGLELRHMALQQCERNGVIERINEFQWAKQKPPGPFVLADYASACGYPGAAGGGGSNHVPSSPSPGAGARESGASKLHPWVRATVAELGQRLNAPEGDILRGRPLANAWSELDDADLKAAALSSIRAFWEANGWWQQPPGPAAKKAKTTYVSRD